MQELAELQVKTAETRVGREMPRAEAKAYESVGVRVKTKDRTAVDVSVYSRVSRKPRKRSAQPQPQTHTGEPPARPLLIQPADSCMHFVYIPSRVRESRKSRASKVHTLL